MVRYNIDELHTEAARLVADAQREKRSVIYVTARRIGEDEVGVVQCVAADILVRQGKAKSLDEWHYNWLDAEHWGRAIQLIALDKTEKA